MIVGLLAPLIAVLVVALVASHEAGGYYLFSPGTAPVITLSAKCQLSGNGELFLPDGTPCVRLVLPRDKTHNIDGELMMVDVEVGPAGPIDWLEYEVGLLGSSRQLYPVAVYAGPTPTSELGCQDTQEMVDANEDSALAALAQLHYKVAEDSLGVQVDAVYAGTPAWRAGLKCDDLITAVNGKEVKTAPELTALLGRMGPGRCV